MTARLFRTVLALLAALTAFAAAPAHAEWLRAETEHFIVYGDVAEGDIRAYAQRVERFDSLLRLYYPITVENEIPKLEIFLANGRRDMLRASPRIGANVGGYYTPNSARIHAVVDLQSMGANVVLFHEYAHHFMFQMRSNAYPAWFIEGFAEYYATADIRPDRIQFGKHSPGRMNSLTMGANSWARMEDVLTWRFSPSGRFPGHAYYAQAWALTHYLMSTPERTQMLSRYLSAVVGGQDSIPAMQAATGRTAEELQNDVRRYLTGPINYLTPQVEIPQPEVRITRMGAAEASLVWLNLRLDRTPVVETKNDEDDEGKTEADRERRARAEREQAEDRAALIRDSLATAARYSGDRMGLLVTAKAQRVSHDPAAALATLQPLLSDSSTDAEALHVAAQALLDQARSAQGEEAVVLRRRASGYLARAMDNDPLDFQIYLGLNDVRRGQARYPTDNDLATLEVAYALAPQSFETRMRLGEAYMAREMNAAAITVLTPVANSPHASSYKRRARAMIATARGEAVVVDQAEPEEEVEEAPAG